MARVRPEKSLARFERIALVLPGGGALGAYQAGAYAGLEACGVRPNWIAATAIGAVNAAIIAGNPPHQRVARLRRFWQELSGQALQRRGGRPGLWPRRRWPWRRRPPVSAPAEPAENATIPAGALRALIDELVDFERVNSGAVRLVLGTVNLTTGAETFFDNDRHVLGPEHVLAGLPLSGLPPVMINRQPYGGSVVSVAALDEARPADTLCFAVNGYDPLPGAQGGVSRSAREIAAVRRAHDLRRMIALLGERLPVSLRADLDIKKCLAQGSDATMTILNLVHEGIAADLVGKMSDFSAGAVLRRWQAGERDIATSLAHPLWLAPPPRLTGVVVHEVRGGVAAPPR